MFGTADNSKTNTAASNSEISAAIPARDSSEEQNSFLASDEAMSSANNVLKLFPNELGVVRRSEYNSGTSQEAPSKSPSNTDGKSTDAN